MTGLFILILIHVVIMAGGATVTLLLPANITSALIISLIFCGIAYLVFAAMTVLAAIQSKQKAMQNGGLIIASLVYFAITLFGSVIFTVFHLPVKIHVLLEIVIMVLGVVLMLLMLLAKLHIEEQ